MTLKKYRTSLLWMLVVYCSVLYYLQGYGTVLPTYRTKGETRNTFTPELLCFYIVCNGIVSLVRCSFKNKIQLETGH